MIRARASTAIALRFRGSTGQNYFPQKDAGSKKAVDSGRTFLRSHHAFAAKLQRAQL
jgi:hypothetical protein